MYLFSTLTTLEAVAGLVVEYLLPAADVLQPCPLHMAVKLVIRHQPLMPGRCNCFLMFHNF